LGSGLVLFGFLAFPWEVIYGVCDLSLWTARFAYGVLKLLNLQGERVGTLIRLGAGSIEVYHGCSGLKMILQLVAFSLIYLVLNPSIGRERLALIVGAIAIGFSLNGIRVAMMAILVSLGDELAFDYWHLGTGSLVFSALGVLVLGLWGWQLKRWFSS
jgi:cyanoexosortase A